MSLKITFLDVETSGLHAETSAVVQVAGIICDFDSLNELISFNFNVRPFETDVLDPEALAISGRTPEIVKTYPPPLLVHAQLVYIFGKFCNQYNKLDKLIFSGYNAGFDGEHMRAFFAKSKDDYFGSWFWNPALDVMSLAMQKLARERHTMENFKLATVCAKLGIVLEQAHDAMADVRATKEAYRLCR